MARLCPLHLADPPPGFSHTPLLAHLFSLWAFLQSLLNPASTGVAAPFLGFWLLCVVLFWCSVWALGFIALGPLHSLYFLSSVGIYLCSIPYCLGLFILVPHFLPSYLHTPPHRYSRIRLASIIIFVE